MPNLSHAISVFHDHAAAEQAIRTLEKEGFALTHLSIVGKGYHTDEKVTGFYNFGDRVRFWGSRGALWGGLWGWFTGGMMLTVPVVGQVVVLGYLATALVSMVQSAAVFGGLSALGAALYGMGIPRDSILSYDSALEADSFLVMARGSDMDTVRARKTLRAADPAQVDLHGPSETTREHEAKSDSVN